MPGKEEVENDQGGGWLSELAKCAIACDACSPQMTTMTTMDEIQSPSNKKEKGTERRGFNSSRPTIRKITMMPQTDPEEEEEILSPKTTRTRSSWEKYKGIDPEAARNQTLSRSPSSANKGSSMTLLTKAKKRLDSLKSEASKKSAKKAVIEAAAAEHLDHPAQVVIKDDSEYEEVVLVHDFFGDPKPRVGQLYAELSVNKGERAFIIDEDYRSKYWWLCKTPGKSNYKVGYLPYNHVKKIVG